MREPSISLTSNNSQEAKKTAAIESQRLKSEHHRLFKQGKFEEAANAAKLGTEAAPQDPGHKINLGNALLKLSQIEPALKCFRTALMLDDTRVSALKGAADALVALGREQDAADELRIAIERLPNQAPLKVQLARVLLAGKSPPDAAVEILKEALETDPLLPGAWAALATAYNRSARFDDAIAALKQAINITPNNVGLNIQLGHIFEEQERPNDARDAFSSALKYEPGNTKALQGLLRTRDPNEIFELLRKGITNPLDQKTFTTLSEKLGTSFEKIRRLLTFASRPLLQEVDGLSETPLEREMLKTFILAHERQEYYQRHGRFLPSCNIRLAPGSVDSVGVAASHEAWTAVQWLTSFQLRQTKSTKRSAVVATMRDEGAYIIEWLANYRSLGFDSIFIYSNNNRDGSEVLLRQLANYGLITFIENEMSEDGKFDPQKKAYGHALNLLPELWEHEWVLFVDADELLIPSACYEFDIRKLLDNAQKTHPPAGPSAICFNWAMRMNGYAYAYDSKPLLRRFQHASGRGGMKSFVKLQDVFSMHRVHFPELRPQGTLVKSDFSLLPRALRWKKVAPVPAGGWLNHYWTKSFEEFAVKKARLPVGWAVPSFKQFFESNSAETEDNFMPPPETFVVRVEAEMERLLRLPNIGESQQEVFRKFGEIRSNLNTTKNLRNVYDDLLFSVKRK